MKLQRLWQYWACTHLQDWMAFYFLYLLAAVGLHSALGLAGLLPFPQWVKSFIPRAFLGLRSFLYLWRFPCSRPALLKKAFFSLLPTTILSCKCSVEVHEEKPLREHNFLWIYITQNLPDLLLIPEKAMAAHSSVLAWRIPGTAEPGGLPSVGWHRVGHDWSHLAVAAAH